ncbi:hypothetical protein BDV96DRAFT_570091 [Lophiotrema nucula]|uniref:C3H1-type domain-containing protein n=1 Tax=Lophiotrema nucula TaxID=690887 RepID=A0A6A5ZI25_9PLEO|nr:hypothetical protein BDV96DRAFT_570091 [Lophiotrema nucula]
MVDLPRPVLSREQIDALPDDEKRRAIAEWSSHLARVKREQEEQGQWRGAYRGSYRGSRGRGGYRGRGAAHYNYQPYPTAQHSRPKFTNMTATFNQPAADIRPGSRPASTNGAIAKFDKKMIPCRSFTSTGVCTRSGCRYGHDPEKTAICKHYLFKDNCTKGDACALSHTPSPHRSPSCVHFQHGKCTNDHCRYSHVHVNPMAPVCEPFARLGYCEKGDKCTDRHVNECPDFTNKGACEFQGCRLPHVVHAGRLRKAAGSHPSSDVETSSAPGSPETVSEEQQELFTNELTSNPGARTLLSQQVDYVPFDS